MTVHALWVGEYADRRLVCLYATRALAEAALLRMALDDQRPVAPEIEERPVVEHVPANS